MKFLPKLIPDWRLAWRFASVQAAVLLALLSGLQAEVLPLVVPLFAPDVWPWVSGGLALAVVVLRLVAQPALQPDRQALAAPLFENHEDLQGQAQPEPDAHSRPADLPPRTGAALLLGLGVFIVAMACTAWVLTGWAR
jgi:hypothetical protein